MKKTRLSVNLSGLRMKNPVMVASGTFGYGKEYENLVNLEKLGAIVTKSITLLPGEGNPPPRIAETASGMLNAIGLENVGIEVFLKEKLPYLKKLPTAIVVSIAGKTEEEFTELTKLLDHQKIAAIEVNISCPNIKYGKLFAKDPKLAYRLIKRLVKIKPCPLIVKLSPDVTDITEIALACQEAGADILSLVNTFSGMAVDVKRRLSKLGRVTGGLSGPAIKPLALRMVWEVYQKVKLPLIGMGGIVSSEDALEFILSGAQAVAVGTANFVNPQAAIKIVEGLEKYLLKYKLRNIFQLVGKLNVR